VVKWMSALALAPVGWVSPTGGLAQPHSRVLPGQEWEHSTGPSIKSLACFLEACPPEFLEFLALGSVPKGSAPRARSAGLTYSIQDMAWPRERDGCVCVWVH
jgi:hypothetical protein